ncbi:uncharacterized protein LOC119077005 isoform X2 [Bradysia coprophila]|uniref:uncharacterized protein LOC119077005 isoform X2 n=1 Tax=Bradysia coprophila TaxID=38358 RepID=UPI00187DAC9F|nr:uncharacterized protein LOC119077005 isoform X2 [Bradysia coprophila]
MFSGNFLLCLCLKYSLAIDFSFDELLVNTSISQATTRIVLDFYVRESSTVVFTTGYVNEANRLRQSDLINEILQQCSNRIVLKFRLQEFCQISSTYPEEFNVIFIDSYEGFTSVFKRMSPIDFDYTGLFAIILTESYRNQYTIITREDGTIYTDGIDGIIFRVLSQRLNFTPILLIPSDEEIERESPREIGTSISVWMKMVHSGKANLTISSFAYTKDRADLLTASFPYFFSSLLFTVPNGRPYTAFEKLFLPFKYIIWSCIGTSFGLGFITIFVLKFSSKDKRDFFIGHRNRTPFLNMFNIFFGGSIQRPPTRNFARTLFCIWIFACTVIRSAYQGAIFDLIKERKTVPAVDTVPQLIEHDYALYMTAITLNMFKFPPGLREKTRTHELTVEQKFLKLMDNDFKGAYITTEASVAYYNKKHVANNSYFVRSTKDRVLLMPMCIYFRKHSCLTDAFDEQIKLYTDSGLINNWVSQFSQKKYLQFQSTSNQRSHQKLKLSQFSGTFGLCFGMICVTILTFCFELLSQRFLVIRKFVELFE